MKHYYSTVDDIVLTYSDIRTDRSPAYIKVYFERPNDSGFDFAEGSIPECSFSKTYGFSQEELIDLHDYLNDNKLLIWQLATGFYDREPAYA